MKRLIIFLILTASGLTLKAQSPKVIEADLVKSFNKIKYFSERKFSNDKKIVWEDSLYAANDLFGRKLQEYTNRFPGIINYPFTLLQKISVDVCTSNDGLFRIYSWDTQTGGTMYFFNNVFQYKNGTSVFSSINKLRDEGDAGVDFTKIYTMKADGQTYYLALFLGIESSRYHFEGIDIFTIDNGKLKQRTEIAKNLSYEYDFGSVINWKTFPKIIFDASKNIIMLPKVDTKRNMTRKFITYKFTGKYFEKIKDI